MKQALEREARVKMKAIAVWSVDGYGYGCHTTAMDKGFESKVKPTHASSHATVLSCAKLCPAEQAKQSFKPLGETETH